MREADAGLRARKRCPTARRRQGNKSECGAARHEGTPATVTTPLLPNRLPGFTYQRAEATWRSGYATVCKTGCFGCLINAHSEKSSKVDGLPVNGLARDSERMSGFSHEEAYSLNGACTNWAEVFFSRMRRAEIGHHHHFAGPYLLRYEQEASWREDYRRTSNGDQF
jgi:ISXO2-like transposase domain